MDKDPLSVSTETSNKLVAAQAADIAIVRTWFSNPVQIEYWAGPNFAFTQNNEDDFTRLSTGTYQSFSLKRNLELLAFGQYQFAQGLLHLARLIVSPHHRSKGYASQLINALIEHAKQYHSVKKLSLYVNQSNHTAYHVYEHLGFKKTDLPVQHELSKSCFLMTRKV